MLRLLTDEHVDSVIVKSLREFEPNLDVVRVVDVSAVLPGPRFGRLQGASDDEVLEWAASSRRVLVTWDRSTVPNTAWQRVMNGSLMYGVIMVRERTSLRKVVEEILIQAICRAEDELIDQIVYVPI